MSVFKDMVNLGLGAIAVSREKAEGIAQELIKKGEISQEEGKQWIDDLVKRGEKTKQEIENNVEEKVKAMIAKLDIPTRQEINELKAQIEQLKNAE